MRAAILGYAERVGNYIAALQAVGVEPLVTLSPAVKASNLNPIDALRRE